MIPSKANTTSSASRNLSPEQEQMVRLKVAEAAGDTEHGKAMRLVNRILKPSSQHDAAHALFDLLHLVGWNSKKSDRQFVAFMASFQALLYGENWIEGVRWLNNKAKDDERKQAARREVR